MSELAKVNGGELAHQYQEQTPSSVMNTIASIAANPTVDVDKMLRLMEMQERMMAKQAEIAFNEAMTRLQPKLPVITKRGKIEFKGAIQSKFAKYEDIDELIRPLLSMEGFSVSFDQLKSGEYSCKLSHVGGHSETKTLTLPADTSGSKNSIQAIGSTVSYAKRYLVGMHLNIITKGEDNDGNSVGLIGDREQQQILDLFAACEMNTAASRAKFFEVAESSKVEEIRADKYQMLVGLLMKKHKQVKDGQ